jgi:hypothetical protein
MWGSTAGLTTKTAIFFYCSSFQTFDHPVWSKAFPLDAAIMITLHGKGPKVVCFDQAVSKCAFTF